MSGAEVEEDAHARRSSTPAPRSTPEPAASPDPLDPNDRSQPWVVRGGIATPEQLQRGTTEHYAVPDLYGFSVQYRPGRSIAELARGGNIRNNQISVATAVRLVAAAADAGDAIRVVPSPGRGFHATVAVPSLLLPADLALALSRAFTQLPNPAPAP